LTLSTPVHAIDRFVAVAADLSVSVLERRLTRQLGGKDVEPWTVVTRPAGPGQHESAFGGKG
jgi:hypothetical protein